ncbi:MAG: Double-strand break repair protein mre11a [Cirrosporium novae-zelandiae]|nr:MAG: Double-strand break repair protein mre11a [Cirrosporium novae-zelandiae]
MPGFTAADTIRILVSTDNHVGYNERDPIRGDDSWKTFDEIMTLAKERDVDMVLLAGDLFHENKPSRKSMYQVMRSLRNNCYGEKPCELEMLSDASENFEGAFNHVNYEDPDINVAIPVFSIHGNHDDPSGEGHLAALDLLQISGLVNYYGRTPESDNILIKPVLLQKGRTKLALYGMSNVRDERLFRTFRDGKVRFFQPATQKKDWFNLMSVHQNHHAHTETSYLPENFLPDFIDLVIWGHEHECLIDPRKNPEMGFYVMQPGSSVATSLVPGETVPKQVAILSITGKQMKSEPIRLKTVRPFIMKEIVLNDEKEAKKWVNKSENRSKVTDFLVKLVNGLISEATAEWLDAQDEREDDEDEIESPLPIVRLRVEYSAPDGGSYDCENPQRFSNRFVGRVANTNDVVQFYRKKSATTRKTKNDPDMPEESALSQVTLDAVKVEKLVREFLSAQSLTILPQNSFGDAVSQFVDKDDKHAMEMFVNESLANQIKHLIEIDQGDDEEDLITAMDQYRTKNEEAFAAGYVKTKRSSKLKPRPENWDTDLDGEWADQPGALIHTDDDDEDGEGSVSKPTPATRGRGGKTTMSTRGRSTATTAAKKASTTIVRGRGKKKIIEEPSEEEEDQDIVMVSDPEEESDSQAIFVKPSKPTKAPARGRGKAATTSTGKASPVKKAPARAAVTASTRQTRLNFGSQSTQQSQSIPRSTRGKKRIPSDDGDEDDDDAFEVAKPSQRMTRSRG